VSSAKDSNEVVEFMTLFTRLKELCDDRPDRLKDVAASDPSVSDFCGDLFFAADALECKERRHQSLLASPVDPRFISAWRDYQSRYDQIVSNIGLSTLLADIELDKYSEGIGPAHADQKWSVEDNEADEQAGAIWEAIDFARNYNEVHPEFAGDDWGLVLQNGVDAWPAWKRRLVLTCAEYFAAEG